MSPRIHILLPVHNRRQVTQWFIECLTAQTYKNYHLILIDDGSSDGTSEMVSAKVSDVTILRGEGDWWWAGSLQQGMEWLEEHRVDDDSLILIINDDVSFAPDYLESAVRVMADKQGVLMLSRNLSLERGNVVESGVRADLRKFDFSVAVSAEQINCLSTRGLFLHWRDMRVIGGFHPVLLPHYWSDYEYTIRANRKGFKCQTSSEIPIKMNAATTSNDVQHEMSFSEFLRRFFSKKSVSNPIYTSSFILLTSPPLWMVSNLARVWVAAMKRMIAAYRSTGRK